MKKNKFNGFDIAYLIAIFVLVVGLFSIGFVSCKVDKDNDKLENELSNYKTTLLSTQDELNITKESLNNKTAQLDETSKLLDNTNAALGVANTTIADLKSEEYELVYVGDFRYTYYCDERYEHICGYGKGITASRKPTEVGWTVAADTSVLPMGSIIYVEGLGFREVMDVGGGVKGKHIDILLHTHNECFEQTLVNGGVWVLVKNAS